LLCKFQALIAIEKQKVAEKEAETQKKIALSEAEKNAQVSLIRMEQKLMEKDSAKRQEAIENEMFVAREKAQTDANFYRYYHVRPRSLILVNIGFGTVASILV
jgi:erlin